MEINELDNLYRLAKELWVVVLERISNPWFLTQFAIIAGVYLVARLFLSPVFKRLLDWLSKKSLRFGNLGRVFLILHRLSDVVAWLVLQWFVIGIVNTVGWPHTVLTIVASLLTAWVLIRFASFLVSNKTLSTTVAVIAWSVAALNILGYLQPTMVILDQLALTIGTFKISLLTTIKGVLALWFALWLANSIAHLVERQLRRSSAVTPAMSALAAKLTRITLVLAAVMIALSAVGIDLTAFAVFSGALGVGLGFGLQKIFSNLVSGIILLLDRSIKPGDVVTVGTTFGWINYLGARYVSVITRDGIEHLIPNEELITQRVENWSFSDNLVRLRIPIGISYRSDPRLAIKLCVEAALEVERIKHQPEPRCQLTGFGQSSVNLELRVWIDDPPQGRGSVITEVLLGVWDRFHENGVEIPFSQHDLHLRTLFGENDIAALQTLWASKNNEGIAK